MDRLRYDDDTLLRRNLVLVSGRTRGQHLEGVNFIMNKATEASLIEWNKP